MKSYIVGSFTHDTLAAHGKQWLESVNAHKGNAEVLVLDTAATHDPFSVITALSKREGTFLFAAPNVRFQAEPVEVFRYAGDKVVVIDRTVTAGQPFDGERAVYESYWAAPNDLLELLVKVVEVSFGVGSRVPHLETNYISYFAEFFPWVRHTLPPSEFMSVFDARLTDQYYVDSKGKKLTAVGLDRPEPKKVGVFSGLVKPGKPLLTNRPEETMIFDDPSLLELVGK